MQNIDTTSVIGSLLFEVAEGWGVDLAVDAGDELATFHVGVRYTPLGATESAL